MPPVGLPHVATTFVGTLKKQLRIFLRLTFGMSHANEKPSLHGQTGRLDIKARKAAIEPEDCKIRTIAKINESTKQPIRTFMKTQSSADKTLQRAGGFWRAIAAICAVFLLSKSTGMAWSATYWPA